MENLERSEKWDKTLSLILPLQDNVSPVYICIHFNLLYVIIGFSYSSFLRKPFYSLLHVYIRRTDAERTLVGLMLKLKRQYFGHLMWTKDSLEKSLMLGKIEGRRRRGRQRMRWLDGITGWTWTWTWEMVRDREAWQAEVHGVTKSWTGLVDWTTIIYTHSCVTFISSIRPWTPYVQESRFPFLHKLLQTQLLGQSGELDLWGGLIYQCNFLNKFESWPPKNLSIAR